MLIDRIRDVAFIALIEGENTLLGATLGVPELIAIAFVNRFLEGARIPAVEEIYVPGRFEGHSQKPPDYAPP